MKTSRLRSGVSFSGKRRVSLENSCCKILPLLACLFVFNVEISTIRTFVAEFDNLLQQDHLRVSGCPGHLDPGRGDGQLAATSGDGRDE